jgi:hypothetical protein
VPVFELTPNGSGGWNGTVIHKFPIVANYYTVAGTPALDKSGNLYGTIDNLNHSGGYVYKLSPEKNGKWTEKILLSLNGSKSDRASRTGVVLDTAGNVYGATETYVYELLAPSGTRKYQEEILGYAESANDLILDGAGNLYGTAANGYGIVFEITDLPHGVVSPTAPDFGQVVIGQTSAEKLVSLKNTGNSELTVSDISISGDFALPTNQCSNGVKPRRTVMSISRSLPLALERQLGR